VSRRTVITSGSGNELAVRFRVDIRNQVQVDSDAARMSLVGDGVIRDVPEIRDLSFSAVTRETLFHLVVYGSFAGAVAENITAESSTGRRTNERDLALYWFSRIGSVA